MNCSEFWKHYEISGLTPEMEKHLSECQNCSNEYLIERELDKTITTLESFKAPERVWENIREALDKKPEKTVSGWAFPERVRRFFRNRFRFPGTISLKPAAAGLAFVVFISIALTYYSTRFLFPADELTLQARAVQEMEETEQKYLAAIEKFSRHINDNKGKIDPELHDLYLDKLAVLDEYILLCKEAVSENEYNINARTYLALAYKEKAETLKEISNKL